MCLKNKSLTQIFFEMRALIWILAMLIFIGLIIFGLTSCDQHTEPPTTIGMPMPIPNEPFPDRRPTPINMYCSNTSDLEVDCLPPIFEPHIKNAEEKQREWEDEEIEREDDHCYGKDTSAREERRQQREDGDRSRIC